MKKSTIEFDSTCVVVPITTERYLNLAYVAQVLSSKDLPFKLDSNSECHYLFDDEKSWLEQNAAQIVQWIKYDLKHVLLQFENEEQAVSFQLTWLSAA